MHKIKNFFKSFPRHLVVAASAWTSKIIVSLVNIISIRELLLYLGEERYAVYLIAYSLAAWFPLANFNIPYSLQNFISESRAKNESYDKYMLSSLQVLIFLFILFTVIIFIIASPVQEIIFRKFPPINDPVVLVVGVISIISVLISTVYNVYFAEHKGYIPNILPAFASIISMTAIVILRHYDQSANLTAALIIFTFPQMLLPLILFIKKFKKFFSHIFKFDLENIKSLLKRASKFYLIGIFTIIYAQTDYIVSSQILPPDEIIKYGIFMRFFLFPIFIYESLLIATWPVRSEMYVLHKYNELKGILKRYSFYAVVLIALAAFAIYIFSDFIISVLAPNTNIEVSYGLIIAFAIYAAIRTVTNNYIIFLNSINALRIFAYFMPFQIVINIISQYFFGKIYGAQGIVMGLIVSMVLTSLWILPFKAHKTLK